MTFNKGRVLMGALFLGFVLTSAAVVLSDDVAGSQAEAHVQQSQPISTDPDACVAGAAALEDIKRQHEKIQAREKELNAKEAELKALEKAVKEEFAKLDQVRAEFARSEELKKKENEEKVAKIVSTLETMSPKPASALLSSVDDALAITAMQRMDTIKLAKIMNVMEPGRSSRLTELLAGVVRARGTELASSRIPASHGAAATTAKSQKVQERGGENNDGQNQQLNQGGRPERVQSQPGQKR